MKAILLKTYGHADRLTFANLPIPAINCKDVLIKVKAVGINPFDLKLMSGTMRNQIPEEMPHIIGSDFAGEIIQLGSRVAKFKERMKVYGSGVDFTGASGSMAEYLAVSEDKIALLPCNCDYEEGAALVTPGCATQQAVNHYLSIKPGEKVLIHGAGGAVGTLATQLCLNIGAQVAVTVSGDDIEYMKSLGVDLIINYHLQHFETLIQNYDAVLDTQGGDILARSYQVLKPGGTIVSLVTRPDPNLLLHYQIHGAQQKTEISTNTLNTVRFLAEELIFRPRSCQIIPFDEAIIAIDEKLKGINNQKIVIRID